MDVNGSVALVIGGQRGIGRAIVGELLARGAVKVYVTACTPSMDRDPRIVPIAVDIRDDHSVSGLAGMASDATIVVNTPGLNRLADVFTGSVHSVRGDFDVNVFGLLSITRTMAPVLSANGGGGVLNILSTASWAIDGGGYSASRAAAWSISRHTHTALAAQGTTVTTAHLGHAGSALLAAHVPKLKGSVLAVRALDALEADDAEVLLDEIGQRVPYPRTSAFTDAGDFR